MTSRFALLVLAAGCDRPCDEPGEICTVVGAGHSGVADPGTCGNEAALYWPSDVTIGPDGQPWMLDWNNHRILRVGAEDECNRVDVVTGGFGLIGDGPFGTASGAL